MKIIDHKPQSWFLFEDGENLIFDVNCSYSFVGYDFLMLLNPDEVLGYRRGSKTFLNKLAEEIDYSCPIARESKSIYKSRKLDDRYVHMAAEAISRWKQESG
jgi:hypothetical protein